MQLKEAKKGNKIKLTKGGVGWTVAHRTPGKDPVITLESDCGSLRYFSPYNTAWDKEVWPVLNPWLLQ